VDDLHELHLNTTFIRFFFSSFAFVCSATDILRLPHVEFDRAYHDVFILMTSSGSVEIIQVDFAHDVASSV